LSTKKKTTEVKMMNSAYCTPELVRSAFLVRLLLHQTAREFLASPERSQSRTVQKISVGQYGHWLEMCWPALPPRPSGLFG
jgi:hypothetical protein